MLSRLFTCATLVFCLGLPAAMAEKLWSCRAQGVYRHCYDVEGITSCEDETVVGEALDLQKGVASQKALVNCMARLIKTVSDRSRPGGVRKGEADFQTTIEKDCVVHSCGQVTGLPKLPKLDGKAEKKPTAGESKDVTSKTAADSQGEVTSSQALCKSYADLACEVCGAESVRCNKARSRNTDSGAACLKSLNDLRTTMTSLDAMEEVSPGLKAASLPEVCGR